MITSSLQDRAGQQRVRLSRTHREAAGALVAVVLTVTAIVLTGCSPASHQDTEPPSGCADYDRTVASASAEIASSTAASPNAPPPTLPTTAPAVVTGFDNYTAVRLCDYPGPNHYGWGSLRFKTAGGVHCELYDGPGSFQYYSSIECWGPLPGVPAGVTLVTLEPGGVPKYGQVDLQQKETETLVGFKTAPIDPASYRTLHPGQKIIVPGGHPGSGIDMNDEICAVDHDKTLICEIQHPEYEDHKTHGFRLSPQGSSLY